MAKSVSQKIKKKLLSDQVKKAMKKYFSTLGDTNPKNVYELVMNEVEPELFREVMRYTNNNQSKAAKILGINRTTLRTKLEKYKISE